VKLLRIAARVAGQVWDLTEKEGLEGDAFEAIERGVDEETVKEMIVASFDKVFGTDFSSGDVPFSAPVEETGTDELFHELLHHAFNPDGYADYESNLEGALHEHAMRYYQNSLGGAEQLPEDFNFLGLDGIREGEEGAEETFLSNYTDDCQKAKNPTVRKFLEDSRRKVEAIIKRGENVQELLEKECSRLEDSAFKLVDSIIPEGTEARIRQWQRQMKVDFGKLSNQDQD
jgi:hypothetical protein